MPKSIPEPRQNTRTLYLVRHAKSSWKTSLPDRQRPLNQRGLRDAPAMGRRLAARKVLPDLLLCSPAIRARETAELMATTLGFPQQSIQLAEELYLASPTQWLRVIEALPDQRRTVMLVGHNPGITEVARELAHREVQDLPTCAVVELVYRVTAGETDSWALVAQRSPWKALLDSPKNPDSAPSRILG